MFELTVKSDELACELAPALRLTERKPTIPHLSYTKLDATPTGIRLAATDLDVAYTGVLTATVADAGTVLVPTKRLYEMARALPGADIQLHVNGNTVAVTGPAFSARFNVLPHEEFPAVAVGEALPVEIPRATLITLLERAMVATNAQAFDGMWVLSGLRLVIADETLTAVGLDGHRLSMATARCPGGEPDETTLDYKGARAVLELARDSDVEHVVYTRSEAHRFFACGARQIMTRVLQNEYPNYRRLIPAQHDVAVECETPALLEAIKRVRILSDDSSSRMVLQLAAGGITLGMRGQAGEAVATVAMAYDGRAHETAFNAAYVAEYLSVLSVDRVRFEQRTPKDAGVFSPVGGEVSGTYMVMPMGC